MSAWSVRGPVMAVVHAAGTVVLLKLKLAGVMPPTFLTWITIAVLIGVAWLWGSIDGWRRIDRPVVTWFVAGVVGGLLGGVLNVAGRALFVDQTGVSQLPAQLTSGAAFTALLIMVPAWVGVAIGARLDPPVAQEPGAAGAVSSAAAPRDRAASAKEAARSRAATRTAKVRPSPHNRKPSPTALQERDEPASRTAQRPGSAGKGRGTSGPANRTPSPRPRPDRDSSGRSGSED